jgi:hypothetical protein
MAVQAQRDVVEQEVSVNDGQNTHALFWRRLQAQSRALSPDTELRSLWAHIIIREPKVTVGPSQLSDLTLRRAYRQEYKKCLLQTRRRSCVLKIRVVLYRMFCVEEF